MDSSLIFDVGCHRGEDSEFYLRKGFRVVAVEANPRLCSELRRRFAGYAAKGRFLLIEKAIAEQAGQIDFFVNELSEWSTICPTWAERNMHLGHPSSRISVTATTFATLIKEYGTPYYLKIDIEGADLLCLQDLLSAPDRPKYISIESEKRSWSALLREMDLLCRLGYQTFQLVNQPRLAGRSAPRPAREGRSIDHRFAFGSSGTFGKDLPEKWLTQQQAINQYRFIFLKYRLVGDFGILRKLPFGDLVARVFKPGWYDTHAAL